MSDQLQRLAEAETANGRVLDDLRRKNKTLRASLQRELDELGNRTRHSTHYEGCTRDHPMCAAMARIRDALEQTQ